MSFYQTADAGDSQSDSECRSLLDSRCRRHTIRQQMQETLYQTADAGDSLSDSGCRRLSSRQQMQMTLSDSGCRRRSIRRGCRSLSIRQLMQETLYQTADAGVSLSDRQDKKSRVENDADLFLRVR